MMNPIVRNAFFDELQKIAKKENSTISDLVAGAGAGVLSTAIVQPLDTISNRIQVGTAKGNLFQVSKSIIKNEGVRGLYKGLGTKIMKIAPGMAITFAAYTPIKKLVDNGLK